MSITCEFVDLNGGDSPVLSVYPNPFQHAFFIRVISMDGVQVLVVVEHKQIVFFPIMREYKGLV